MYTAKDNKPWELKDSIWKSKQEFFTDLRGNFRKGWNSCKLKMTLLSEKRVRVPIGKITKSNPEGMVWGYICNMCKQPFRSDDVIVDHIVPCGTLKDEADILGFVLRQWCIGLDDIQILCKPCHKIKNLVDNNGYTWREAFLYKERIELLKQPVEVKKAFLEEKGYHPIPKTKKAIDEAINAVYKEMSK